MNDSYDPKWLETHCPNLARDADEAAGWLAKEGAGCEVRGVSGQTPHPTPRTSHPAAPTPRTSHPSAGDTAVSGAALSGPAGSEPADHCAVQCLACGAALAVPAGTIWAMCADTCRVEPGVLVLMNRAGVASYSYGRAEMARTASRRLTRERERRLLWEATAAVCIGVAGLIVLFEAMGAIW